MSKIYLLNNQKFDGIVNIEVFKIQYLDCDIDFQAYDGLIITSKNAIYSINSFTDKWKNIPCYAIANKTATVIEKNGGKIAYIGESSHGDDFALELIPNIKDKKVLYLRAEKTVSKLVEILKSGNIQIDEKIVYKTVCNDNIESFDLEKNSTVIFTSPSTINCFFKKFKWDKSFKAIVIGKTTAKYLPKNIECKISSKTSIEECIKLSQMAIF